MAILVGSSTLFLFFCSSLRHALFKSNAYDLGLFDQFTYLLSQGLPPIVSLAGYHFLGDHAAVIFYPLAGLYWLYADVHWLFLIQSLSLALGSLAVWGLARQAGLTTSHAKIIAIAYLLYPLVFNANLYDFHPEAIAIPGLLAAIWSARANKRFWFIAFILLVLSCKAVLSLTVAAMGIWLFWAEKRRWAGIIALSLGITWFAIATQLIIPSFLGKEHNAVSRYAYLGDSVLEIVKNLVIQPKLVLARLLSLDTLEYLALLLLPVAWGLSLFDLAPLIAALPTLAMNILSDAATQRNLVMQYSVPILPFLMVALISAWSAHRIWLQSRFAILTWSAIAFFALAKYGYFWTIYLDSLDTWAETRNAIALVNSHDSILTAAHIAPHLTHRQNIQLAINGSELLDLEQFDYILLDSHNPNWNSSPETVQALIDRAQILPHLHPIYQQGGVVLFAKRSRSATQLASPIDGETPDRALNGR